MQRVVGGLTERWRWLTSWGRAHKRPPLPAVASATVAAAGTTSASPAPRWTRCRPWPSTLLPCWPKWWRSDGSINHTLCKWFFNEMHKSHRGDLISPDLGWRWRAPCACWKRGLELERCGTWPSEARPPRDWTSNWPAPRWTTAASLPFLFVWPNLNIQTNGN